MEIDPATQTANKSFIDKVNFSLNEVGLILDISILLNVFIIEMVSAAYELERFS